MAVVLDRYNIGHMADPVICKDQDQETCLCQGCSKVICEAWVFRNWTECTDEDCRAPYCGNCMDTMGECSGCLLKFCPIGNNENSESVDDACLTPCSASHDCEKVVCLLCQESAYTCYVCQTVMCDDCRWSCPRCESYNCCKRCKESGMVIAGACDPTFGGCGADACIVCASRKRTCNSCGLELSQSSLRKARACLCKVQNYMADESPSRPPLSEETPDLYTTPTSTQTLLANAPLLGHEAAPAPASSEAPSNVSQEEVQQIQAGAAACAPPVATVSRAVPARSAPDPTPAKKLQLATARVQEENKASGAHKLISAGDVKGAGKGGDRMEESAITFAKNNRDDMKVVRDAARLSAVVGVTWRKLLGVDETEASLEAALEPYRELRDKLIKVWELAKPPLFPFVWALAAKKVSAKMEAEAAAAKAVATATYAKGEGKGSVPEVSGEESDPSLQSVLSYTVKVLGEGVSTSPDEIKRMFKGRVQEDVVDMYLEVTKNDLKLTVSHCQDMVFPGGHNLSDTVGHRPSAAAASASRSTAMQPVQHVTRKVKPTPIVRTPAASAAQDSIAIPVGFDVEHSLEWRMGQAAANKNKEELEAILEEAKFNPQLKKLRKECKKHLKKIKDAQEEAARKRMFDATRPGGPVAAPGAAKAGGKGNKPNHTEVHIFCPKGLLRYFVEKGRSEIAKIKKKSSASVTLMDSDTRADGAGRIVLAGAPKHVSAARVMVENLYRSKGINPDSLPHLQGPVASAAPAPNLPPPQAKLTDPTPGAGDAIIDRLVHSNASSSIACGTPTPAPATTRTRGATRAKGGAVGGKGGGPVVESAKDELRGILEAAGCPQHYDVLKRHELDLQSMALMSTADFKAIGISLGSGLKIIKALETVKAAPSAPAPAAEDNDSDGSMSLDPFDKDTCKICLDAKVQVVFLECGHQISCERCGNPMLNRPCPICRVRITRVFKVFV